MPESPKEDPVVEVTKAEEDVVLVEPEDVVAPEKSNDKEPIDANSFSKEIPEAGQQEEEVLQVVLKTGDKIELETDVDEEEYNTFNTFKST